MEEFMALEEDPEKHHIAPNHTGEHHLDATDNEENDNPTPTTKGKEPLSKFCGITTL